MVAMQIKRADLEATNGTVRDFAKSAVIERSRPCNVVCIVFINKIWGRLAVTARDDRQRKNLRGSSLFPYDNKLAKWNKNYNTCHKIFLLFHVLISFIFKFFAINA